MATHARTMIPAPSTAGAQTRMHVPLWASVVLSRLLIVGVAAVGALHGQWSRGWRGFDPNGFTLSLGSVGNVIAASTDRWDALHYVDIARTGYVDHANAVFFPLYPLLIHAFAWLVRSDVLAGVLISLIAFATALELLRRLTTEELGASTAQAAVLLLAFAPVSFFFTAIYTQSQFLALSLGAFYLGRRGRFGFAGALAGAAALTHMEGAVLAVPLGIMYLQRHRALTTPHRLPSPEAAALALPLLAPVTFAVYLHTRGYSLLAVLSGQSSVANARHLNIPPVAVARAISVSERSMSRVISGRTSMHDWITGIGFHETFYLVVVAISVAALVGAWKRLPRSYSIYSGLVLLIFASSPAVNDPLESIDRFVLVLFPLWMAAAAWLIERRLVGKTVLVSGVLLCIFTFDFAHWVFIA